MANRAFELVWREYNARKVFLGDTSRSAAELIQDPWPHTAADLLCVDSAGKRYEISGWLYFDERSILFIGDVPLTVPLDREQTNDDRLWHLTFAELGHAEVRVWRNPLERRVCFGDRKTFIVPTKYAKRIASLANVE